MKVLLFDIDGTLVNTAGAGRAALEQAFAEAFDRPFREELSLSGRTDRGIAHELFAHAGLAETEEHWRRLRDAYLARLPGLLRTRPGRVLPGVVDVLARAAGVDDIALGLLTGNVRAGARAKLEYFGLDHHFAFGGFGDDHANRDDVAAEALAAARQRLDGQVRLERVWVIGDTPLDVRCARAIGAKALAVATGWHDENELRASRPDALLRDLSDVDAFFDLF